MRKIKKLILTVLFLFNVAIIFGALEDNGLFLLGYEKNYSMELLIGIIAFSVFGLFSIKMFENSKKVK